MFSDPDFFILETTAAGSATKAYVWADTTPVVQIDITAGSDDITTLHTDHLNTPRVGTDANGTVVWGWDGEAFGATLANEDPDGDGISTTIYLRFPGQYYDQETGLHYNWNRYYDPRIGRYITSDSVSVSDHVALWQARLGDASGSADRPPFELNPYAYVANNPLQWADPSGSLIRPPASFQRPPKSPGRYACNARCPTIPTQCPAPRCPVVYGYGADISLANAIKDAKSDANSRVPFGCQAKHCTYKCTSPRGDPIFPSN